MMVKDNEFPTPEDVQRILADELPASCWFAEIRDGECLSRELDDEEYRAVQKVFADFFYKVNNDNLVVAEETPAFDSQADEFNKFAEFDEEALDDAKEHGIAVFFANSCKPSMSVNRMGFLFNDPDWPVAPGETNLSFVPWSLFAHFSSAECEPNGQMCLMQDDLYAKSDEVFDEPRAQFDNAMKVWGNLPHTFNFGALGFSASDITEVFAAVKRALAGEETPADDNSTPEDSTPEDNEPWG